MHAYMEYGALRQAQLIRIPATGAAATVIATARMGGKPQFTRDAGYVYLNFDDGLNRVALDGSGRSRDRKSTRLNSSHLVISYAVFCLKKKKNKEMNSVFSSGFKFVMLICIL